MIIIFFQITITYQYSVSEVYRMDDQIYAKLDVKDNEGNLVGFAFVKREQIPHAGSLSLVPQSFPQGQQEEDSVSLEDDLDLSSSDDDEDLQQPSQVQQMSTSPVTSPTSTSHEPRSDEEEEEKEDGYEKLLRLVEDYDKTRLARRLHNYSKYRKAFNAGWTRLCQVGEGESIKVSYKSPDGNTFSSMRLVSKYLREKGSSLSKENFGFEKKFLGFGRKQETISVCENYHGQVSDRQSQGRPPKQSKFVWLREAASLVSSVSSATKRTEEETKKIPCPTTWLQATPLPGIPNTPAPSAVRVSTGNQI